MTAAAPSLSRVELERLDRAIEHALDSGDESGLEVLGYGEISTVVAWDGPGGRLACKRLPLFDSRERVAAYAGLFEEYVGRLRGVGVEVVPSGLDILYRDDGRCAVYCLQPALPADDLATRFLGRADEEIAASFFSALLDLLFGSVSPRLGLDGQLSNWAFVGDELCYLDVSTPFIRDSSGADTLDTELFIASIPWAMRPIVRRFLLRPILDKYYDPRGVVIDILGNLFKERLTEHLSLFVELANLHVDRPITEDKVRSYYRTDARVWAGMQALRRADRAWQRRVRRRQYPFLLPGAIER